MLVLLKFPDFTHFEAFRDDPTAVPIMRKGGAQGPPQFTRPTPSPPFPHRFR